MLGNAESIELLEHWLGQAKKGHVAYVAVVAVENPQRVAYDYAGAYDCEEAAQQTLKELQQELEQIYVARRMGPRDFSFDAACVEWPLSGIAPVNWDFLTWLIDAEMTRRREGAPFPLRVGFSKEELLGTEKRQFFNSVLRPLVPTIGGIVTPRAIGGRHKRFYMTSDIVVASRRGEEVPQVKAMRSGSEVVASYLHGVEPVTITLREACHLPWRNSNVEAWCHFAHDLEAKGQPVVFIRDTAKAMVPLNGFATFPRAAFDVGIRLALYEQSRANLFVSNGPGALAWFSDRPYAYLVNLKSGLSDEWEPNDPEWWYGAMGINVGEQWPWAQPDQQLVWKEDTYSNISEAWEWLSEKAK